MIPAVSADIYLKVVDLFREREWAKATYGEIARLAGIDRRKVSYLWLNGLKETKDHPTLPPIKRVAEDEIRSGVRFRMPVSGVLAMAPTEVTPDAVIAPALVPTAPAPNAPVVAPVAAPAPAAIAPTKITRADIEQHAQEALLAELRAIAAVRDAAVGAAVSARKMLGMMQGRLDRMAEEIVEEDARGNKVDKEATSKFIHRILLVADKASQVTKQVIESERLALGSPTEIIKVMEEPAVVAPDAAAEAEARSAKVLALLANRRKDRAALPKVDNRFVEEVDEDSETEPADPVDAAPADTELEEADRELDAAEKDPEATLGD